MRQYTPETIWVGLDVHQASITAAILYGDNPDPEVVRLPGDLNPTRRLFRHLAENGVPRACYEASGAGYVLQRALDHNGFHCDVIAPSLIPSRPDDHRKTDRLDAIHLARMYRSGNLSSRPLLMGKLRLMFVSLGLVRRLPVVGRRCWGRLCLRLLYGTVEISTFQEMLSLRPIMFPCPSSNQHHLLCCQPVITNHLN